MIYSDELRRYLVECDIPGVKRLWAHVAPHLPQPENDYIALATIHRARTEAESIPFGLRAYSHRWLLDHELPSGLPEHLKPKAEQMTAKIVSAVGISVNSSEFMRPIAALVQSAMETVVEEAYADNDTDPALIRARMDEAKRHTIKKLLGVQ